MMDVESVITLFLIFLNILIVSYSFKNNIINNSDNELKTTDSILKKSTNLPIFIVKIIVFLSIILSFIIFSVPLLECISLWFPKDILEFIGEFIGDFTFAHLFFYLISFLFPPKYNFVQVSVYYCIWNLIKVIINLSLPLLS